MKISTNSKSKIISYAFIQLTAKGLSLLSNYIIAIVTTNSLFGYVTLLQATLIVSITFFGFNLQSAFVRYFFSIDFDVILRKSTPILSLLFGLSSFLTLLSYLIIPIQSPYHYFSFLPLIGFIHGYGAIVSIIARSTYNFKIYTISALTRPIMIFALAASLFFLKLDVIKSYIICLLFSGIIVFLVGILYFRKLRQKESSAPHISSSNLSTKAILLYTFPLFLTQLMSLINNVSDKYILKYYLDIGDVGLYGKAYVFGSSLGLFLDSLMLLWLPYVMQNKEFILTKKFKYLLQVIVISAFVSLGIFILGLYLYFSYENIFKFSRTFILILFITASAFTFRIGYQIMSPILSAYDQTSLVAKISAYCMLIGLILNLILIPKIGVVAAAIATLISFLTYSVASILFTIKLRYRVLN